MNQTNTSSDTQSVTLNPWAYFAVVLCTMLLLSGCSEEIADQPIDLSNRVEHQFPQQHLGKLDSITGGMHIHSSGDYLYLTVFREKKDYSELYSLKYYDFRTGEFETIEDLGLYFCFHFELDDRLYTTSAVTDYEQRKVRCYEKKESIAPLGNWILEWIYQMNGKLLIKEDRKIISYVNGKEVGSFNLDPDFLGIEWTHSRKNIALLAYTRYDESKGEADYSYPRTYYLVTFDDSLNIVEKKRVLQETETVRYEQFQSGRKNEILFARRIDSNGDKVVDYDDRGSAKLMSMNLKTLEISVVCEELMDLWRFEAHKDGRIFFYDETEDKQAGNLWFLDRSGKAKHVVMHLDGGRFMEFGLDENWEKLVYMKVLDTNRDGYRLYQDDVSEIYLIDLKGLMDNKF